MIPKSRRCVKTTDFLVKKANPIPRPKSKYLLERMECGHSKPFGKAPNLQNFPKQRVKND